MTMPAQVAEQARFVWCRSRTRRSTPLRRLYVAAIIATTVCGLAGADKAAADDAAKNSAAPKTVSIAGRVVDSAGKTIQGVDVTLYQYLQRVCVGPLQSVKTSPTGTYGFAGLSSGGYLIKVVAPGFAPGFRSQYVEEGQRPTLDIRLAKPARLTLSVHSQDGKALPEATLREITIQGPNGNVWLNQSAQKRLGWEPPASDSKGRLSLPPLATGDIATITVDQPDFAPIRLKDVRIEDRLVDAALSPGVKLTFRVEPPGLISTFSIRLDHEPFSHPSTVGNEISVRPDGTASFTVEPGQYSFLWLKHDDYLITPWLQMNYKKPLGGLRLRRGEDQTFPVLLHRKVAVKGRVINRATGKPVADALLKAEIPNASPTKREGMQPAWMLADWPETNSKGEYTTQVAAGTCRITFVERNYVSDKDVIEFQAAANGSTVVPDIHVSPAPKVKGLVLRPDGSPASNTVVRFRGNGLRFVQPTLTDGQGRFELQVPFIPTDDESGRRLYSHPLVAFHAFEPLAAQQDVRLDRPETLTDIKLTLRPEPFQNQLQDVAGDLSPWERKDLSNPALRGTAKEQLRGQSVPDLTGTQWINVARPTSLSAGFKGKFVLLDFWTTWCGPCHGDFPSVKLAERLYGDRGFAVVGVHDNSVAPKLIREHVLKEKMTFAIAIDTPDGRSVRAYTKLGLCSGYPSYVLLSPDSTVLLADNVLPGPTLRAFKLELIRAALMGRRLQAETRTGAHGDTTR
jgi:thiol-disulfide isomerase/thioredoxin